MRKVVPIDIPIGVGAREDVDPRMMPQGAVAAMKNMRLRKEGRWGVRNDYTALGRTTPDGTNFRADHVVNFDDRLHAFGALTTKTGSQDIWEYIGGTPWDWRMSDPSPSSERLTSVTEVRDMGRIQTTNLFDSTTFLPSDVATANGLVCFVRSLTGLTTSAVHIFNPVDDSTVLLETVSGFTPRVVAVGDTFFITVLETSRGPITLYRYDTSSDTSLTQLSDAFSFGVNTLVSYEAVANFAGDGFWIAASFTTTPATTIRPFDSSGSAGTDITGPATAHAFLDICETENRVHLAVVRPVSFNVFLHSYTTGGTESPSARQVGGGGVTNTQPSIVPEDDNNVLCLTRTGTTVPLERIEETSATVDTVATWNNVQVSSALLPGGSTLFIGQLLTDSTTFGTNVIGKLDSEQVLATKDYLVATDYGNLGTLQNLPSMAQAANGKVYGVSYVREGSGAKANIVVTEFQFRSQEPRSHVSLAGELFVAGGSPQVYDSRILAESGFVSAPTLKTPSASNGAGSLPSSSTIELVAVCDYLDARGRKTLSDVSLPKTVAMGASDDTVDVDVVPPPSSRDNESSSGFSQQTIKLYRTQGNSTILKLADELAVGDFGDEVSFTLTGDDDSIATNEIVYTQDGRAALGTVLPNEPPRPCRWATPLGERVLTGGLPNPFECQVSKRLFPGEALHFSGADAFILSFPDRVRGVASLDRIGFVFSRENIWALVGEGPDDSGAGQFEIAKLPGATGLKDWRSLAETPLGLVFQGDDDKLWLLPRGGGAPQSFGDAVEDTLASFPEVKAAFVARQEQLVCFACENSGGTDSRILSYDLRAGVWNVDEFDGSTPVSAACAYQGRIARVQSGIVYLEDSDAVPSTFLDHGLTFGEIRPFHNNAWGRLVWFIVHGEFRGNCTVTARVSYDGGANWTTLGNTFELTTGGGYAAGDEVRLQWYPERRKGDRFTIDIQVTDDSGNTPSEGLAINGLTIGVQGNVRGGPRLPSGQRG